MNLNRDGFNQKRNQAKEVEFSYASVGQHPDVDLVGLYLREIGRYQLLTAQQEQTLARASKKGDDQATEKLLLSNLRLVVYAAREYKARGSLAFLDLVQEGNIGLLRAIKKFDPERGFRFSTYAMWWVHHAIRRVLSKEGRTVRLPQSVIQLAQKIEVFEQKFLDEHGTPPTNEATAQAMGVTLDRLTQVKMALQSGVSLEESSGDGESSKDINDILTDDTALSPEKAAFRDLWWEALQKELPQLSPRQYEVFQLRYGLEDGEAHTLASIGKKLGISRERARQLEKQGIEKLRRSEELQRLAELFNQN